MATSTAELVGLLLEKHRRLQETIARLEDGAPEDARPRRVSDQLDEARNELLRVQSSLATCKDIKPVTPTEKSKDLFFRTYHLPCYIDNRARENKWVDRTPKETIGHPEWFAAKALVEMQNQKLT